MPTEDQSQAIVIHESQLARVERLEVADVVKHSKLIRQVMENVMQEGMHYGTIPGTKKPTLYQPGAQVLALTFQLHPKFVITKTDLGNGHREIEVITTLTNNGAQFIGEGVGSCSTMESKYRYRSGADYEDTGQPVPKTYWALKNDRDRANALRQIMEEAGNFAVRNVSKVPGQKEWHIVKFSDSQTTVENPNIADTWNTVLKMGKKRSYVDAILNSTGASDVFTQDLDDLEENLDALQAATGKDYHPPVNEEPTKTVPESQRKGETWRDCVVHIKCSMKGKPLGDLTLAHLRSLKTNWIDAFDFNRSTFDDRKLRKAIVEGLGELEMKEAKEQEEAAKEKPAKEENLPTQGSFGLKKEKANTEVLLEPREEELKKLRAKLKDAEMLEADFIEELAKRNGWPLPIAAGEELTLDAIDDAGFLEMLNGKCATYLQEWGYTAAPPPPPAVRKGQTKKKK